jgi:hypothetical protein
VIPTIIFFNLYLKWLNADASLGELACIKESRNIPHAINAKHFSSID